MPCHKWGCPVLTFIWSCSLIRVTKPGLVDEIFWQLCQRFFLFPQSDSGNKSSMSNILKFSEHGCQLVQECHCVRSFKAYKLGCRRQHNALVHDELSERIISATPVSEGGGCRCAALNRGERVGGRQRKGEKQRGKREREESVHYTGWIFPEYRCWNTLLSWPWCRVCMPTACVVPPLLPGSLWGMRTCLWGTLGQPLIQIWASFCGAAWTASLSGLNTVIGNIVSSWGVLPCCGCVTGKGCVPMVPLCVFLGTCELYIWM